MKVGLQVGQAGDFRKYFALASYRAVSLGSQETPGSPETVGPGGGYFPYVMGMVIYEQDVLDQLA